MADDLVKNAEGQGSIGDILRGIAGRNGGHPTFVQYQNGDWMIMGSRDVEIEFGGENDISLTIPIDMARLDGIFDAREGFDGLGGGVDHG